MVRLASEHLVGIDRFECSIAWFRMMKRYCCHGANMVITSALDKYLWKNADTNDFISVS